MYSRSESSLCWIFLMKYFYNYVHMMICTDSELLNVYIILCNYNITKIADFILL